MLGLPVARAPAWIAAIPWAPNQEQIAELADMVGLKVTVASVVISVFTGGFLTLLSSDDLVTLSATARVALTALLRVRDLHDAQQFHCADLRHDTGSGGIDGQDWGRGGRLPHRNGAH